VLRGIVNGVLLLALLASLGAVWALRPDPARPNREIFPEMVRTQRYNAFAPNPNFPDGKTLQGPVAGTIPRGPLPLHYAATPADALRAAEELKNPYGSQDAAVLARGAFVFANFCAVCHGGAGRGDGPVPLRGFPAPPSLLADHAMKMKDGQMFHVLSYGQNNMPSYAGQLSREDRWKAIVQLRELQAKALKEAASTPAQAPPAAGTPSAPKAAGNLPGGAS
jgi:mono/diheme cytochrome c family protein